MSNLNQRVLTLDIVKNFVQSENQFIVDFEEAWAWCGYSTKANALRKLKSTFQENIDYIVFINSDEKPTGKPSSNYKLTADCFKHFGMIAQTEKGKEIRSYFIKCENELKAIKSVVAPVLSPEEILLIQAQNMVAMRKELNEVKSIVNVMVQEKNTAIDTLKYLEEPKVLPLQKSDRSALNQLVRTYAASINKTAQAVWNVLYNEFLYTYHMNIKERAKGLNISTLDYLESIGKIPDLYALAYKLFIDQKSKV